MKPVKLLALHLLCLLFVAAAPLQSAVPMQSAVSVEKEPRHHVKFENQFVRVIDAAVAVNDATLFHTHALDNVPVCISGGKLKTQLAGQQPTFSTLATGVVSFAKGGYTHQITNVGDTPLRFIDAEILASPKSSTKALPLDKVNGTTLILENDRVRIYRIVLEQGQATGLHTHKLSGLSVVVSKGKVAIISAKGKAQTTDFNVGDFRWHDGILAHSIKNVGAERFEMVDIEWK
jgi:quercetin dioxygenase-like cupin family protein